MASSSSSTLTPRKTRAINTPSKSLEKSTILEELQKHLHAPTEFIQLCNQYSQSPIQRSAWIQMISSLLIVENVDRKILLFILDCLIENHDHLSELQFKQNLLPFIKEVLITNDEENDLLLSTLRCLIVLVEYRPNILTLTFAEWSSCLLNFLVTNLSATTSLLYGDLIIELLSKIVKQFTPLSKEIVDILGRTSPTAIITTGFLNQLKVWIQNTDDVRLALFAIHLWESLAALLSRSLLRGHAKGNEILVVIEDAFLVSNYSIRSAAFTAWSFFISHIHQTDDIDPQQLNNRLLKLFLTPFLSDSTSKSKSASISKCHAWLTLISLYPKNISDVILPFLSFAFGNHISCKTISTTTAWWTECRHIGGQFLHNLLLKNTHAEYSIQLAGDDILNYLFDSIVDQLLEYSMNSTAGERDPSLWLSSWNAYLNHLIHIFQSNHVISDQQRVAINTCLLTRIEQLWIDSRIETRFLLKLFETFEQIGFPLAVETVLCDSSTRTKTLSAAQIHPSSGNHKSQDKHLSYRTTLSDQYLHMMLEHAIRFNDEDQTNEEAYLHVISYLIDTLSKTSDENFCYQTSSLLLKCSVEFSHQPLTIPSLFWHIWYRCSTHLIQILNRSLTFELHDQIDNQKQETSIELLLRPFAFTDIQRLDYSYTLLWTQLFKALCRLALIHNEQSKHVLVHLLVEILRNEPAFEQAINDQHNQRLFGLILIIMKTILKTFAEIDLSVSTDRSTHHFVQLFSNPQKRSQPSSSIILCLTQLTVIINDVLQRLLSNNENNTQYSLVCCCLLKSNKVSSAEQTKAFVFTYIRDLIVDLFSLCKIYSHLEIVVTNLTHFIPFLHLYESTSNTNLPVGSSPISIQKQQIDHVVLNKLLSVISTVFEPSSGSSLLQLIYPLLILAFQHQKTIMRNKARKCWNETFGRMTFIVYPNELRMCLRDLKDKEHLLLPCFLADHDNSNTAGSGAPPSSTDESQLSQQIDIATPLVRSTKPVSSPARFTPSLRSTHTEKNEPVFVPIVNNINHSNQADSPVIIGKRLSSSISSCLTEKQKEKLRTRQMIPLLCDDNSDTQSNSCTVDTPLIESMMAKHQLRSSTTMGLSLFKQPSSNPSEVKDAIIEISVEEIENHQEDVSEESTIAKKLRRSCRPSISARKSLTDKTRKPRTIPSTDEITLISTSVLPDPHAEQVKKPAIKGILKRLSPTKPRQDHTRRVVFHDQVKVLVFPSPLRRDPLAQQQQQQQRKKSPYRDDTNSPTRVIPKENLPLRKQPMSARRLSAMQNSEPVVATPPVPVNKARSSKLFHPNDALADWTQSHEMCQPTPSSSNENQSSTTETPNSTLASTVETNLIDQSKKQDKLYDVDTLMDSLDYEKLDLNDKMPSATRQTGSIDEPESMSPLKRCLSPMSPEDAHLSNDTLSDRLQKAADVHLHYRRHSIITFLLSINPMKNLWYLSIIVLLMTLESVSVIGKPMFLACDTYATSSTCSQLSSEGKSDCDTCCSMLLERMFECPPCRYFVLNNRRQGSSCFCTVCFKQQRHRRRHQLQQQQQNEDAAGSRFDF